jgi:microcystin-dependent protein
VNIFVFYIIYTYKNLIFTTPLPNLNSLIIMKKNLLLFVLLFATAFITNAQTVDTGIAIQGIARDNVGVAKDNQDISLTFTLYYGSNTQIYQKNKVLSTDAKGVFSTILDLNADQKILVANHEAKLKIEDVGGLGSGDDFVISDAELQPVPYAVAASNGVPTGAIMPFVGSAAPAGWMVCDNRDIPISPATQKLRDLLNATKTPDLRGQFLSGAGGTGNKSAKEILEQAVPIHTHTITGLDDHNIPAHRHTIAGNNAVDGESVMLHGLNATHDDREGFMKFLSVEKADQTNITLKKRFNYIPSTFKTGKEPDLDLSHSNASISSIGSGSVVRPESYVVTYIIKL